MVLFLTKSEKSRRSVRLSKISQHGGDDGDELPKCLDEGASKTWSLKRHFSFREKRRENEEMGADERTSFFGDKTFSLLKSYKGGKRTQKTTAHNATETPKNLAEKQNEKHDVTGLFNVDEITSKFDKILNFPSKNQKTQEKMLGNTPSSAHRSLPRHGRGTLVLPINGGTFKGGVQKTPQNNYRPQSSISALLSSRYHSTSAHYLSDTPSSSPDDSSASPSSFLQVSGLNCTNSTTCSSSSSSSYVTSSSYELSADFLQKQIELLEKKYGGKFRAQRAASVIQRTYRRHCMGKKFRLLLSKRNRRPRPDDHAQINRPISDDQSKVDGAFEKMPQTGARKKIDNPRGFGGPCCNQPISPDDPYWGLAPKLKLHPYNVGGGNPVDRNRVHFTAPLLTSQLKLDRQGNLKADDENFAQRVAPTRVHDQNLAALPKSMAKAEKMNDQSISPDTSAMHKTADFSHVNQCGAKTRAKNSLEQISFGAGSVKKRSASVENKPKKAALIYKPHNNNKPAENFLAASALAYEPCIFKHSNLADETCMLKHGNDVDAVDCFFGCREDQTYFSYANNRAGHSNQANQLFYSNTSNNNWSTIKQTKDQQPYKILSSEKDILTGDFCGPKNQMLFGDEALSIFAPPMTQPDSSRGVRGCWQEARENLVETHDKQSFKVNYADRCPVVRVKSCRSGVGFAELHSIHSHQPHRQSSSTKAPPAETPTSDDSGLSSLSASRRTSPGRSTAAPLAPSTPSPSSPPIVWLPRCRDADDFQPKPSCSTNLKCVVVAPCSDGRQQRQTTPKPAGRCGWARRSLMRQAPRTDDVERKRQYRIALNFFNKKPERGVQFLVKWNFVEPTPAAVAKFLLTRKGLSKQMIGEYLGTLQHPFNMAVLDHLSKEMDFHSMEIDDALRHFQSIFRLPGEAQKIERIVEVFAKRYWDCNVEVVKKLFKRVDTVFILSFAIIMLNTDLHSPNVKPDKRMKVNDFIKNLRGIDGNGDVDSKYLTDLYNRIKFQELKSGPDHVTQVLKVERSIVGKKPSFALNYRRLVCYCRLYEVSDPNKKQSPNAHQREVFLFNDMLLIAKTCSRKKNCATYSFRESHCLVGLQIETFRNHYYQNGLRVKFTLDNKILYFNSRNEEDRTKFVEDLKESVMESDEMEALRIELELEKQSFGPLPSIASKANFRSHSLGRNEQQQQRDSGVADIAETGEDGRPNAMEGCSAVASNDDLPPNEECATKVEIIADAVEEPRERRVSCASLDSGMSSTTSIASRDLLSAACKIRESHQNKL